MSETPSSEEKRTKFTPSVTPEEELEAYRQGVLPNNDRTYLMAHAADTEINNSKLGSGIDPNVAAEAAGMLYDRGLNDKDYDYVLKEGLTEAQRDELAQAIHPEGEIIKYFDPLTGLSNRQAFQEARAWGDRSEDMVFVEFDLNKLKKVNERGHEAGDDYIRRASRALARAGADAGINTRSIFRVGGDEFVALLPKSRADAFQTRAHELFIDYMSAIGDTYTEADQKLMAAKKARDEAEKQT